MSNNNSIFNTWLTRLTPSIILVLLLFVGMAVFHIGVTTVDGNFWYNVIDGRTFSLKPMVTTETEENVEPFAEHLEPYQKIYRCNCELAPGEQILSSDFGGGFAYGTVQRHWKIPNSDTPSFRLRTIDQTLIRQVVTNQFKFDQTKLAWNIHIDGYLSEDAKYYFLHVSHTGGNFANCEVDYYVDFDRFFL